MNPSLLTPDNTAQVTATGSIDVDFDLPRFGVSLVTILPATGPDGGKDVEGKTPMVSVNTGCACGVSGHANDAQRPTLVGLGALLFLAILRPRRCTSRPAGRFCKRRQTPFL
jgi:hypothetical protein